MNINKKVRDYLEPRLTDGGKDLARNALCVSFRSFETGWINGRDTSARINEWLDALKPDVEILGFECVASEVIVAFLVKTKAAE